MSIVAWGNFVMAKRARSHVSMTYHWKTGGYFVSMGSPKLHEAIWGIQCQEQKLKIWISNNIHRCNYLSMPYKPVSGTAILVETLAFSLKHQILQYHHLSKPMAPASCNLIFSGLPVSYLGFPNVLVNQRRRYRCNIFSYWLRPCSAINGKWELHLLWLAKTLLSHK